MSNGPATVPHGPANKSVRQVCECGGGVPPLIGGTTTAHPHIDSEVRRCNALPLPLAPTCPEEAEALRHAPPDAGRWMHKPTLWQRLMNRVRYWRYNR